MRGNRAFCLYGLAGVLFFLFCVCFLAVSIFVAAGVSFWVRRIIHSVVIATVSGSSFLHHPWGNTPSRRAEESDRECRRGSPEATTFCQKHHQNEGWQGEKENLKNFWPKKKKKEGKEEVLWQTSVRGDSIHARIIARCCWFKPIPDFLRTFKLSILPFFLCSCVSISQMKLRLIQHCMKWR